MQEETIYERNSGWISKTFSSTINYFGGYRLYVEIRIKIIKNCYYIILFDCEDFFLCTAFWLVCETMSF